MKSYSIKSIILFIVMLLYAFGDNSMYAVCTPDMQKRLEESFAHNSVAQLFVDELEKVYTDKAITNNVINYSDYYKLINLFDCSHALIEENKNALVHIKSDDFTETSVKAVKFLKKFIEDLYDTKRRKFGLDHISNDFIIFSDYSEKLKEFRKQALIDILIYTQKPDNSALSFNFERFYKDKQYQEFFDTYQSIFPDLIIDKDSKLDPRSYEKVATFARNQFEKLQSEKEFAQSSQTISQQALDTFMYLYEFKEKAALYRAALQKRLSEPTSFKRFFRFNKKKIQAKIDELNRFISYANQMLEAIFITNLYERPPIAFAKKLEEATPVYRLILAETKALGRIYNRVRNYFLSLVNAYTNKGYE